MLILQKNISDPEVKDYWVHNERGYQRGKFRLKVKERSFRKAVKWMQGLLKAAVERADKNNCF